MASVLMPLTLTPFPDQSLILHATMPAFLLLCATPSLCWVLQCHCERKHHTLARMASASVPLTLTPFPDQALISHATTPATLLLCATPLSVLGAAMPLLVEATGGSMNWNSVMGMAVLTGLGNSMG